MERGCRSTYDDFVRSTFYVVIKDRRNRMAVVIETKISESMNQMSTDCQKALLQIEQKKICAKA